MVLVTDVQITKSILAGNAALFTRGLSVFFFPKHGCQTKLLHYGLQLAEEGLSEALGMLCFVAGMTK